ncbi:MAG: helix-turn-helix domain-containing protein [Coriobacteriales bacterium]|nr:helix-turn-helix domain-containing protein [Coriobacteriales bacterium]
MKLSMWILAEWLESHNPRVFIHRGEAEITGVRIITEGISTYNREHIYIAAVSEPSVMGQHSDTIVLAQGNDYLFINNSDSETLINEVLAAFDYYNQWEARLREAAISPNALQKMISLSDEVFGFPNRIMDADGRVIAISEKFGPNDFNERWRQTYETRFVQLRSVGIPVITFEGDYLPEWEEVPRRYCYYSGKERFCYIAASIVFDDEIIAAFMIEEYKKELSQAQCQLATVFCDILRLALKSRENDEQYFTLKSKASIVHDLLEGKMLQSDYAHILEFSAGCDTFILLAIKNILGNAPVIRTRSMLTTMRGFAAENISLEFDNQIVSVFPREREEAFIGDLMATINATYYMVGISLPFEGWGALSLRLRQANFAMSMGGRTAGIYRCEDYAYKHLIKTLSEQNSKWEFCHPGVLTLMRYDEIHGTEFFETLYRFLAHERRLVDAAQALHIHRNTLIYRIKRIGELLAIDLEDAEERAFILLSYEILRAQTVLSNPGDVL